MWLRQAGALLISPKFRDCRKYICSHTVRISRWLVPVRHCRRLIFLVAIVVFCSSSQNPAIAFFVEQKTEATHIGIVKNISVVDEPKEENIFVSPQMSDIRQDTVLKNLRVVFWRDHDTVRHWGSASDAWVEAIWKADLDNFGILEKLGDEGWGSSVICEAETKISNGESRPLRAVPMKFKPGIGNLDPKKGSLQINEGSFGKSNGPLGYEPKKDCGNSQNYSKKSDYSSRCGTNLIFVRSDNGVNIKQPTSKGGSCCPYSTWNIQLFCRRHWIAGLFDFAMGG